MYDPVAFAHDMINWPHGQSTAPYQDEVLAELVTHRREAVRGPHGLGKSCIASIAILWFATTRDAAGIDWKIPTTASAWRHLSVYLWPEIHKWARRLRWDKIGRGPFSETSELLKLNLQLEHGAASAVASNKAELIEGAHADSLLYLVDEAKIVPNDTWDAIEGAFSGGQTTGLPEAFALAISTPGSPAGRFYEIHRRARGLEDWHTRHVTLDEAVAAGRISQNWADQRAKQWGRDSALFANRVLGEFYAGDEDAVIPLSWLEAAVDRWHAWVDAGRPDLPGRRIIGVDVARGGADSTVLAHRTGVCVERLEEHSREDTMRTTARVLAALVARAGNGRMTAVIDSIGIGAGVVDRLRELRSEIHGDIIAYTGSARSDMKDRSGEYGFANTRSAAYWRLRELLEPSFDSEVMLPPDDILLSDLNAPTWDTTTGVPPKIRVEPKEKVTERLGRSPDQGDAVAMAFYADAVAYRPKVRWM
jgi:hypothetical protein